MAMSFTSVYTGLRWFKLGYIGLHQFMPGYISLYRRDGTWSLTISVCIGSHLTDQKYRYPKNCTDRKEVTYGEGTLVVKAIRYIFNFHFHFIETKLIKPTKTLPVSVNVYCYIPWLCVAGPVIEWMAPATNIQGCKMTFGGCAAAGAAWACSGQPAPAPGHRQSPVGCDTVNTSQIHLLQTTTTIYFIKVS